MANLIDLRRRIRSVRNTQQITRAMKFVAAAKLKKAQDRVFAARPYARRLLQMIHHLALRVPDRSHPLLQERGDERIQLVIVSGDKGLCGAFNSNIFKAAYGFMGERPASRFTLTLVGKKGYDHFSRRKYSVYAYFVDRLAKVDMDLAGELARPLMEQFLAGAADRVFIVYNQFKSVLQQQIVVEQLLPITRLELPEPDALPTGVEYIFEQPAADIFGSIFPRHVVVQIYHALLESVASEQGARMAAMDSATRNAAEMIDKLVLFRNRVRQAAITKEIIEIVSGANALG